MAEIDIAATSEALESLPEEVASGETASVEEAPEEWEETVTVLGRKTKNAPPRTSAPIKPMIADLIPPILGKLTGKHNDSRTKKGS